MELSWADLDEDERDRIREAFEIARGRERLIYRQNKGRLRDGKREHDLIGELESLARTIDRLSDEAKNLLGPLREDAVLGWVSPSNALEQLRHHLEVLTDRTEAKPGRAQQMARHEALYEAWQIWVERGGEPKLGQLRRETRAGSFHPNSFTRFLADCLLNIDPEINSLEAGASAAHSALRPRKR